MRTTDLVHEVHHSSSATRHENDHHWLVFAPSSQMTDNEHDEGQWEGGTGEIIFNAFTVEDEPDELDREANPEEHVEFDETEENLVIGIHGLDATVGAKELVHFPAEVHVDFPSKGNVRELCGGDDTWDHGREHVDGYVAEANGAGRKGLLDFAYLDDGIH